MKQLLQFIVAFGLVLTLFSPATPASAADGRMKITEMAVTTRIVRGNPIDSVHRISVTSVRVLYCFTRIAKPGDADTMIRHVWYLNDEKAGEYALPVKGERWRTYSKKAISRESVGEWRVEALDSGGNLLKSVKFRIN
ncbi:MAG: DUF2914 domain-containing protein [Geobacteraceae bacterium]